MPCVVDRRRERDRGGEEVEKGGDDVMVPALEEGVEMCGDVWRCVECGEDDLDDLETFPPRLSLFRRSSSFVAASHRD